ncbi:TonB-dependent receptor domain-containing protein [Dechloromonas sp. HYN0024]|uniref:TonB-dependent receptor domain-containing protein n=1 Tax=Dechloromonas sp. HYN0024 TaxID=2231055 RepID=UPI0013C31F14|nr:TonB-dependent receptor [Dechloromonas sp. HYN0024]
MHPRLHPLAALLAVSFAPSAFALEQLALLDPVVVTATRQSQRANEAIADITIIDRHDIENAGPATTLAELLGRSTGIEFGRAGGHGADESVFIRGTNSGHALVLLDGIRVNSATTGSTAIQMIPLSQIERIEILRGPASAIYGSDAIGGVIQIFTRSGGEAPRFTVQAGAGSASTYESSVAHANRIGNFSYSIKAGVNGTQGINGIESTNYPGYNPDKDGYRNNNLNLNAGYRLNPETEIGAGIFNAQTVSRYDAYQTDPNTYASLNANRDYEMKHRTSGAYAFATFAPTAIWKSNIRIAQGVDRTESPESLIGDPISLFKTTQNQYTWQNDIALPLGTLLAGLERLEQEVDSTKNFSIRARSINSAMIGWNASINAHAIQLNARSDDNSQFGQHQTWLAGYGFRFAPAWRIAASFGTAFKAPTMNDLYFPTTPGVGGGNANLKPEESRNGEVSLRYQQGTNHARITYFHNTIRNLIEWTTDPNTYYSTPANVGEVKIEGIEMSAGTTVGNWLLNANATIQDPKDMDTDQQLRRRAKAFGNVSATYVAGPFKGGIEWKMVGTRYDDPHWQTRMNQVRMGSYAIANLFGEYSVAKDWSLFARVDNLFDKNYEVARSKNVIYGTPGLTAFAGIRYTLQ